MSLCASCGLSIPGEEGSAICPHHHHALDDAWARENRIICDLIHRKTVPSRLPVSERELDAAWAVE